MPTINCPVQGEGTLSIYSSLVGASLPWQAVDDSGDTTHDSDTSYIVLAGVHRLLATLASVQTNDGDSSFVTFTQGDAQDFDHQATTFSAGERIAAVRVTWVAKDPDGNGDVARPGIKKDGIRYFGDPVIFDAGSGYVVNSFDWTVDPSDGQAWTKAKIDAGLQSCLIFDTVNLGAGGAPRLTMIALDVVPVDAGIVSFPLFLMAEHMKANAITVRVGTKLHSGAPVLNVGFLRGGVPQMHASPVTPGASYAVASRSFTTNPYTGAAWQPEDIVGLEGCAQAQATGGSTRLTLLNGHVDYSEPHNYDLGSDRATGSILA